MVLGGGNAFHNLYHRVLRQYAHRKPKFGFGAAKLVIYLSRPLKQQVQSTLVKAWDLGVRYYDMHLGMGMV